MGITPPQTQNYDISKEKGGEGALFFVSSPHGFMLKRVVSVGVHQEGA